MTLYNLIVLRVCHHHVSLDSVPGTNSVITIQILFEAWVLCCCHFKKVPDFLALISLGQVCPNLLLEIGYKYCVSLNKSKVHLEFFENWQNLPTCGVLFSGNTKRGSVKNSHQVDEVLCLPEVFITQPGKSVCDN